METQDNRTRKKSEPTKASGHNRAPRMVLAREHADWLLRSLFDRVLNRV